MPSFDAGHSAQDAVVAASAKTRYLRAAMTSPRTRPKFLSSIISCITAQLAVDACVLPSVTEKSEQQVSPSTSERTSAPVVDAGVRAARAAMDSGSTSAPVSMEPAAVADASVASNAPSSAAGTEPNAGRSGSMSAAGQSGNTASGAEAEAVSAAGQRASGGTAAAQRAEVGATCRSSGECSSGYCFDGVCCSSKCEGECSRCNASGSCELIDGEPDEKCPDSRYVCVRGVCLLSNGSTCANDYDCASGKCSGRGTVPTSGAGEGRCCVSHCATCEICNADGSACLPISGPNDACPEMQTCVAGRCMPP